MKSMIKTACASMLAAATLFGASANAAFEYYVNFYLGGQLVGQGVVGCFDEPIEYILLWGIDQGEMVVIGRENCSPFPPPLP